MMKRDVYRLTAFIFWPHAGGNLSAILSDIESTKNLTILRIVRLKVKRFNKLIRFVYRCDRINPLHIAGKTKFLNKLSGDVYFVLVGEVDPELTLRGTKKNIVQSIIIENIKNKIRRMYNPRTKAGQVSDEHVVHATDDDVDALRIWSYVENINTARSPMTLLGAPGLDRADLSAGREIVKGEIVARKSLSLDVLFASIYRPEISSNEYVQLKDTPHYRFLLGEADMYFDYINACRGLQHRCFYSSQKFLRLVRDLKVNLLDFPPVMLKVIGNKFVIVDGLHRVATLKFLGEREVFCEIVE